MLSSISERKPVDAASSVRLESRDASGSSSMRVALSRRMSIDRRSELVELRMARERMLRRLKAVKTLSGLDTEQLSTLLDATVKETFAEGDYVFHQGDPGSSFYIIISGTCLVLIRDERSGGEDMREVAELRAGHSFGELALIQKLPRSATIMCTEATTLLRLDQTMYNRVLLDFHKLQLEEQLSFIKTLSFMQPAIAAGRDKEKMDSQLGRLSRFLKYGTAPRGTVLYEVNSNNGYLYFIREGSCSVVVHKQSDRLPPVHPMFKPGRRKLAKHTVLQPWKLVQLATLSAGDFFGDEHVLAAAGPLDTSVATAPRLHVVVNSSVVQLLGITTMDFRRGVPSSARELMRTHALQRRSWWAERVDALWPLVAPPTSKLDHPPLEKLVQAVPTLPDSVEPASVLKKRLHAAAFKSSKLLLKHTGRRGRRSPSRSPALATRSSSQLGKRLKHLAYHGLTVRSPSAAARDLDALQQSFGLKPHSPISRARHRHAPSPRRMAATAPARDAAGGGTRAAVAAAAAATLAAGGSPVPPRSATLAAGVLSPSAGVSHKLSMTELHRELESDRKREELLREQAAAESPWGAPDSALARLRRRELRSSALRSRPGAEASYDRKRFERTQRVLFDRSRQPRMPSVFALVGLKAKTGNPATVSEQDVADFFSAGLAPPAGVHIIRSRDEVRVFVQFETAADAERAVKEHVKFLHRCASRFVAVHMEPVGERESFSLGLR